MAGADYQRGRGAMPDRADLIYEYDGSIEGMYSCIFESFEKREIPMGIRPEGAAQTLSLIHI